MAVFWKNGYRVWCIANKVVALVTFSCLVRIRRKCIDLTYLTTRIVTQYKTWFVTLFRIRNGNTTIWLKTWYLSWRHEFPSQRAQSTRNVLTIAWTMSDTRSTRKRRVVSARARIGDAFDTVWYGVKNNDTPTQARLRLSCNSGGRRSCSRAAWQPNAKCNQMRVVVIWLFSQFVSLPNCPSSSSLERAML